MASIETTACASTTARSSPQTLTQRLPLVAGSRVEVGIRADEIVLLEED